MTTRPFGLCYSDLWLLDGVRTGFADYGGVLRDVSATDLGITVGRALLARAGVSPEAIDAVVAANVAQSSFDAFYLARQIGLYSGLPIERPAHLVHRLCGSGFDTILQAADAITLGKAEAMMCVGTESMSRNPLAAYTHRAGFRLGQVEFGDFLWESTLDTSSATRMGDTAENLAKRYGIGRAAVDSFAAQCFERAIASAAFRAGEIVPVEPTTFECPGYRPRVVRLPKGVARFAEDDHVRPTPIEVLSTLKPAFGGVQTGGNSSAIVDGAAGCLVARGRGLTDGRALGRIVAGVAVGVPPEIMGIGPAPAIRAVLDMAGLSLDDIGRFEINEAFGAQYLAVEQELGLDRTRVNVNGGAIALGHPLGASGTRLTLTLARTLKRDGLRWGVASACAGGGQGVAILIENPEAA